MVGLILVIGRWVGLTTMMPPPRWSLYGCRQQKPGHGKPSAGNKLVCWMSSRSTSMPLTIQKPSFSPIVVLLRAQHRVSTRVATIAIELRPSVANSPLSTAPSHGLSCPQTRPTVCILQNKEGITQIPSLSTTHNSSSNPRRARQTPRTPEINRHFPSLPNPAPLNPQFTSRPHSTRNRIRSFVDAL